MSAIMRMESPQNPNVLIMPVSDRDHSQGNPTAKITLVEYGDYQCPDCRAAHYIVLLLQHRLGNRIRFVFRHFPQPNHAEAFHAAEAAEAAAAQNKFWEMHSLLLQQQDNLADSNLLESAIVLFLDVNQFLAEMASDYHKARVQADIESGIQSGVIKTPTFFINGMKYNDEQQSETLLEAVVKANRQ